MPKSLAWRSRSSTRTLLGKAFAKAQALGRPRARALEHEVGPAAEPLGRFPRSGLGPIDPPELLGAVQAVEGKRLLWALSTRPVGNGPRAPVGSPSSTRPSPPPRRGRPGAFRHTVRPRPRPAPERAPRRAVDRSPCRTVARRPRADKARDEALLGATAPSRPASLAPVGAGGTRSDRCRAFYQGVVVEVRGGRFAGAPGPTAGCPKRQTRSNYWKTAPCARTPSGRTSHSGRSNQEVQRPGRAGNFAPLRPSREAGERSAAALHGT